MNGKLAIVIPAYRSEFFARTLESLAAQTCKDFNVYVGDDASPEDISSIAGSFAEKLSIRYRRFEENLGGKDLSAHWMRCVEMVEDEDWVWMFSDDDLAQPRCVESFYETDVPENVDVLHFNLDIIGSEGNILRETPDYPERLSSRDFFNKLYRRQIDARMQEFVFRTNALKTKGFVSFDLAWRTDNASVMNLGYPAGIMTVSGADSKVQWRAGNANISVNNALFHRKNSATVAFFNWVGEFFEEYGITHPMSRFYEMKTVIFALDYENRKDFISEAKIAAKALNSAKGIYKLIFRLLILYRLIY